MTLSQLIEHLQMAYAEGEYGDPIVVTRDDNSNATSMIGNIQVKRFENGVVMCFITTTDLVG